MAATVAAGARGAEPQRGGRIPEPHPGWWPGGGAADERDALIGWLRGEFAAANAIIDLLVTHLVATAGEPGEYDHVAAAVLQRRHHWTPFIHLQQHFPVTEVAFALQQVNWRRHPQAVPAPRRPGFGFRHGHSRYNPIRENNSHSGVASSGPNGGPIDRAENSRPKPVESASDNEETTCNPIPEEIVVNAPDAQGDSKTTQAPTTFMYNELFDGRMVNVLEGLKLHESLVNVNEINNIISWMNELKANCQQGLIEGHTYTLARRPMKGHGREIIQLGISIIDGPSEERSTASINWPPEDRSTTSNSHERKVEAVPSIICDLFDKLHQLDVLSIKPDYCIIDVYNEGDHSHPHTWPLWYGRPVCTLSLTECEMVFGRVICADPKGHHQGPLRLSLATGSLLVLQGSSADLARHAIPSVRKKRMLLTFGKFSPRKSAAQSQCQYSDRNTVSPPMPWRMPDGTHHPPGVVVQLPPVVAHHLPPDGIRPPVFIAPPPLASSSVVWKMEPTPGPGSPCPPVIPGTGVFLPPGSGHLPSQLQLPSSAVAEQLASSETAADLYDKNKGMANGDMSPKNPPTQVSDEEKPETGNVENAAGNCDNNGEIHADQEKIFQV